MLYLTFYSRINWTWKQMWFSVSVKFHSEFEQMFQLSLQLEIPYVHIYLIGKLQDTYAHGYSRAFGKIGSTCILPAVARKCFLFWGSSETHMIQCTLYSGSETTYISRVHVRILCTTIADQLKSIRMWKKKFVSFSWSAKNIPGML